VLGSIFGSRREEEAGGWSKLHNEELHNLYQPPNISVIMSRKTRWARYVTCMAEMRNA
jgi:hypothetical protein